MLNENKNKRVGWYAYQEIGFPCDEHGSSTAPDGIYDMANKDGSITKNVIVIKGMAVATIQNYVKIEDEDKIIKSLIERGLLNGHSNEV